MCDFYTQELIRPAKNPKCILAESLASERSEFAQIRSLDLQEPQSYGDVAALLQIMAQKMDSVQIDSYFRAGRAYFTIRHAMGQRGNLFFKSVFENVLKGSAEKPHVASKQDELCVIFRI